MIRGTTPRLEFVLPFDTGLLAEAWVTISQNRSVVIDKRLSECVCEAEKLICTLTQEETLRLSCDCKTELQVRARTEDGNVLASEIIVVSAERILKDGVI